MTGAQYPVAEVHMQQREFGPLLTKSDEECFKLDMYVSLATKIEVVKRARSNRSIG